MNSTGNGPKGQQSTGTGQLGGVAMRDLGLAFLIGTLGGGVLGVLTLTLVWLSSSDGQAPSPASTTPVAANLSGSDATPVAPNMPGRDASQPEPPPAAASAPASGTPNPEPPPATAAPGGTPAAPDPSDPKEITEKLHRVALAMHIHHDRYRVFPVGPKKEWLDDQGWPRLSWRVHLLPFLDQQPLYDLFHLDEPWDSPNNKPLSEKMPDVFRSAPDDGTVTRMHVLSGDTMLFRSGRVPRLADCRDGTSQTFMIVHAGVDRAALWTKPDNLAYDPNQPLAALGDLRSRSLQAAMVDGKVRTFPPDLTPEEFGSLATPNGGEVVDVSSVARRRERGLPAPVAKGAPGTAASGVAAGTTDPTAGALAAIKYREATSEKLKEIGLAMLNFHDTFRRYPPPENKAQLDPQGRPFLSWRVHLLRFLDQEPLYKQFKLDEPWDSPHNRPLLDKMPDVYREVDGPPDSSTTRVLTFTGPNTPFPGSIGIRMMDMRDGTACTILLVRAGRDKAVPWTKPVDLPFDETAPLGGIGLQSGEDLLVVLADISVRHLNPPIPNDVFKALVTPAGGEKLEQAQLQEIGLR